MKPLLNVLYVTTDGAYLARQQETVLVRVERETKARFPAAALEGVVCLGRVGVSPQLLDLCARAGIYVSWLSSSGRPIGRFVGPTTGNVLLRRAQYRKSDDLLDSAGIARFIVLGKIANCRHVLLRAAREAGAESRCDALRAAADRLAESIQSLQQPLSLDTVRGHEGEAAASYFAVFDDLIIAQKADFTFAKRSRRPPLDPINALLSFLYTLLVSDLVGAVEAVGLDPAVGFLHRDRPGRPGLALDLLEELRPVLADRLALSLVNRQQIKASSFKETESRAVLMTDAARKEVIKAYQSRKRDEIVHPVLGEKIELGLLPHVQALLMARHIRGDLEAYPPFLWR